MDTIKVLLSDNVKKVLTVTNERSGFIAGWNTDTESYCLTVSVCTDYFLPGLEVNGIYCRVNSLPTAEEDLLELCDQEYNELKVDVENCIVLFIHKETNEDDGINLVVKSYSPCYNTLSDVTFETITSNPAVLLRARGQIPCLFEITSELDTLKENIDQALEKVRNLFQKGVAAFLLQNSRLIQHNLNDDNSENKQTIKQLLKSLPEDETNLKSKIKKNLKKKIPVDFDILIQASGSAALDNSFNHSVVIHSQTRDFQCASLHVPLDVLVICQEYSSTYTVYKLFLDAIEQQLIKINQCLNRYSKGLEIDMPVPYHFYSDIWEFPITLIYPLMKTDEDLESYRKELHKKLLLPMDRPFLKKLNVHDFSLKSSSGHLYNPHEGLTSSGVPGGKSAIVPGTYSYHHYMQDHINDNGWGCAYRSLQTIVSWFIHQGYTDKSVPTHTEIQEVLVKIGDKPQSFIGSKKWIGSQEVSFCLDQLIQVQSRIMFVSSGAEMASKGRELFNHFRDQGTPVMIGGGVLAHTILGVDFNQDTGDLKFLILDPHYTGSEDLNIILNKGWCGWKDLKFWDQNAFYNLCLPQRPKQI